MSPKDNKYIEQLTWLRGIAAFFVIVSHTINATNAKYLANNEPGHSWLLSSLNLGSFGVVLFFALSGCTLYISNSDKLKQHGLLNFYIKRIFRIWPAFFVSLVFYLIFRIVFSETYIEEPKGFWVEKQFLANYMLSDIIRYLSLTFNFTGPEGLFNNAYWSLPVEFQYYIIFPIIVLSLKYIGVPGPIIIGGALYLFPKFGLIKLEYAVVFKLAFSFCGGVIVGYIYKNNSFRINSLTGTLLFLTLITLISLIVNSQFKLPDIPFLSNYWNWYGIIAITTIYIVLITNFNIHNRLEDFLKYYGTISYSTYLYHNLFIGMAVLILIYFKINDENLRLTITFFFTLIMTYFTASLSYKLVEAPSISLGRKFNNKLAKPMKK